MNASGVKTPCPVMDGWNMTTPFKPCSSPTGGSLKNQAQTLRSSCHASPGEREGLAPRSCPRRPNDGAAKRPARQARKSLTSSPVQLVKPGSQAEAAGIQPDDIIEQFGEAVTIQLQGHAVRRLLITAVVPALIGCSSGGAQSHSRTAADESAQVIQNLFGGEAGPKRDIVLANAATALMTANACQAPEEGVKLAAEAIDSGKTAELVRKLAEFTHSFS